MKLKTDFNDEDIIKYQNFIQHKFDKTKPNQGQESLINIKKSLEQKHILALVIDDKEQIIGTILCKIEENFFNIKQCHIIDIELSQNCHQDNVMNILYHWLTTISQQFLCQEILYLCLTKNKFLQKFFTSKKFILEQFVFKAEIT